MYHIDVLILFGLAILYPFFLTNLIRKKININNSNNIKEILKNTTIIILILIGTILITIPILEIYSNNIPSSSSDLCNNSGGWNYTCKGNDIVGSIYFIILGIIFSIHSIISTKYIYKIFSNSKKIFPYIFMYLYIFILYLCQIMLSIYLYGLFISVNYTILVNIFRFIILLLPSLFYIISINIVKNKQ